MDTPLAPLSPDHDNSITELPPAIDGKSPDVSATRGRSAHRALVPTLLALLIPGLFWAGVSALRVAHRPVPPSDPTPPELPELPIAVSHRAVFDAPNADVRHHPDYRSIVEFGRKLSEVAQEKATPELHERISTDRYVEELRKRAARDLDALPDSEWSEYADGLRQRLIGPEPFYDFVIFRIDVLSNEDRLVWLHAKRSYDDRHPVRWWITRVQDGWKLYDWEPLELGLRASHERAIRLSCNDDRINLDYDRYVELVHNYAKVSDPDTPAGKNRIRRILSECEMLSFTPRLFASEMFITARRWHHNGDLDRALSCLERFRHDHSRTPGAFRLTGKILLEKKQYAQAAEAFRQYIERLGPTLSVLENLAECYDALEDHAAARETRLRIILYDDRPYSQNLFRLLHDADDAEQEAILNQVARSVFAQRQLAALLGQTGAAPPHAGLLGAIERFAESRLRGTPIHDASKAVSARLRGSAAECAEWLIRIIESSRGERVGSFDDDDLYLFAIETAVELDLLDTVFQKKGVRHADLEKLHELYWEDDIPGLTLEQIARVAELRLQVRPGDPYGLYLVGMAHAEAGRFRDACEALESASVKFGQDDRANSVKESLYSRLAQCYYRLRSWRKLEQLQAAHDVFSGLIWVALETPDIPALQKLIASSSARSVHRKLLQALIDAEEGRSKEAQQKLLELLPVDDSPYSWRIQHLLVALHVQDGTLTDFVMTPEGHELLSTALSVLRRCGDWETLDELTVRLEENGRPAKPESSGSTEPRQPVWPSYRFEVLIEQRRWREAVDLALQSETLSGGTSRPGPGLGNYYLTQAVSAAIRIGDLSDAERLASLIQDSEYSSLCRVRIAIERGDFRRAREELGNLSGYRRGMIVDDISLGSETMRQYRRTLAVSWSRMNDDKASVGLLARPIDLRRIATPGLLREVFGDDAEIRFLPHGSQSGENQLFVLVPPYRVSLACGPSTGLPDFYEPQNDVRRALQEHSHVLMVHVSLDPASDHPDDTDWKAYRLLRQFELHGLLALSYRWHWLLPGDLPVRGAQLRAVVRSVARRPTRFDLPSIKQPRKKRLEREMFERRLYDICRRHQAAAGGEPSTRRPGAEGPAGSGLVLYARFTAGGARKTIRLRFDALQDPETSYGRTRLLAVVDEDFPWNRLLEAGQKVELDLSDVVAWEEAGRSSTLGGSMKRNAPPADSGCGVRLRSDAEIRKATTAVGKSNPTSKC